MYRLLHEDVDNPREGELLRVSGPLKSISIAFWALGKKMSCTKTGGPILTVCTFYDVFLRKKLPFGGPDDCISVKNVSGVIFFHLRLIP